MPRIELTTLQDHLQRWKDCQACLLCEDRSSVVLGKGTVPCDILFCGEAPGESENILGRPFEGPAGVLLDDIIEQSIVEANQRRMAVRLGLAKDTPRGMLMDAAKDAGIVPMDSTTDRLVDLTYAFTNLVCCIPYGDDGVKLAEPPDVAVRACAPRLHEFIELCNPKRIVCVGRLSHDWLDPTFKKGLMPGHSIPLVQIHHPAYILRANRAMQGLLVQKAVVTLRTMCEEL